MASATARWCARRAPRVKSSTPSWGKAACARRARGPGRRDPSARAPASPPRRGRASPPRPIARAEGVAGTEQLHATPTGASTWRVRGPSRSMKPRWWRSGSREPGDVPRARRESHDAREDVPSRPFAGLGRDDRLEVVVLVDERDRWQADTDTITPRVRARTSRLGRRRFRHVPGTGTLPDASRTSRKEQSCCGSSSGSCC